MFTEGVVEIWLTSEDLGAYGHDIGVTLPQLLWQLVDVIPEGARMRLGMTNPPYILEHLEVYKYPDKPWFSKFKRTLTFKLCSLYLSYPQFSTEFSRAFSFATVLVLYSLTWWKKLENSRKLSAQNK